LKDFNKKTYFEEKFTPVRTAKLLTMKLFCEMKIP